MASGVCMVCQKVAPGATFRDRPHLSFSLVFGTHEYAPNGMCAMARDPQAYYRAPPETVISEVQELLKKDHSRGLCYPCRISRMYTCTPHFCTSCAERFEENAPMFMTVSDYGTMLMAAYVKEAPFLEMLKSTPLPQVLIELIAAYAGKETKKKEIKT